MAFLTYLLTCQAARVPVDGEHVSKPNQDILSSHNMLHVIEWAIIEAVKHCSKFVECVVQIG